MEDISEKLRLIDYENNFCRKNKKDLIGKFYFAHNMNITSSKPSTPSSNNSIQNYQFVYFYELCNWLLVLIKQVMILLIL